MTEAALHTIAMTLTEWDFTVKGGGAGQPVRLPHDAMIHEHRDPRAPGGADTAYFPGGAYRYSTNWDAPADRSSSVALRFEGVQGDATVTVNGTVVGSIRSGYTEFEFEIGEHIAWGASNTFVVDVDNAAQPTGRWYPGSGLYRPVSLLLRPAVRFAPDGLKVRTLSITAATAEVQIGYSVLGLEDRTARVAVELRDGKTLVSSADGVGVEGVLSLVVDRPRAWSADSPHLYELIARVDSGDATYERRERVGLRTIAVDSRNGLRINGRRELLRGACMHHDNGVLGAATHRAAEYRRIRLLKGAGFNAVRSAHHPMSRHLLDACDELGMYVVEELADYWVASKSAHDAADRFHETWREDADRMIRKDRNRPSVIMYAAGNEIPETATPQGVELTREITAHLHAADPDRPVTLAINLFLNTLVSFNRSPYKEAAAAGDAGTSMAGSTEANVMINQIGRMMDVVSRLPQADKASRDAFAEVDVAGYNYGIGRYDRDVRAYPDRVILGTETLPGDVARAWGRVLKHPAVIGDFVWAGWEYLGEAGVAVWVPGKKAGLSKPYPYLIAGPGMFDLIGQPDITLRLAQLAWGDLHRPAIGVRPLDRSGMPMVRSAWRVTDAVESWSWRGSDGRKSEVQIYSADDHVELLLNGRRVGRRRAGRRRGFRADFTVPYEPGTLEAVGYRNGIEVSRSSLRSATGPLRLRVEAESRDMIADGDDLLFAEITVVGENGVVEMLADEQVAVTVDGPGEVIGFGSSAPSSEESYTTATHRTFRGRVLAVIRSTGAPGTVTVTARGRTLGTAELAIDAREPGQAPLPASPLSGDTNRLATTEPSH
ncbi:glycoside hydrolase family 2 protein [Clavibacter michiganensis subsp. michiganensis]|uniref:glycoside hydrolase family 2 protein n=1 Tax=Clavibacter michiganensis TaxID=28447 RepID=UPI001365435B|nr:glycoside hydrolase family 2 TIM barrel-domain containing protein [Clavibacter michiganensis]MWJ16809.1 glycoside hydrolase family 2 protein [Clavibacter michiganensis subsp. michiganensis]